MTWTLPSASLRTMSRAEAGGTEPGGEGCPSTIAADGVRSPTTSRAGTRPNAARSIRFRRRDRTTRAGLPGGTRRGWVGEGRPGRPLDSDPCSLRTRVSSSSPLCGPLREGDEGEAVVTRLHRIRRPTVLRGASPVRPTSRSALAARRSRVFAISGPRRARRRLLPARSGLLRRRGAHPPRRTCHTHQTRGHAPHAPGSWHAPRTGGAPLR